MISSRHGFRLYSDTLTDYCHQNEADLHRLKEKMIRKDPCYQYGMQHWHPDSRKSKYFQSPPHSSTYHTNGAWENHDVMFTSSAKMHQNHVTNKQANSVPLNNDCYLCTTLEEHKLHLARKGLKLKEKKKARARIDFVVPLPVNKRKKRPPEPDAEEVLYKVTVRTANKNNAGTSANVFITLYSNKWSMQKRQLKKKMAWVQFHFGKGTSEVFFLKGPQIGDLKYLTVEHDGLETKHGWLLKEIEVTNMTEKKSWMFSCQQWLSLYEGDLTIKKNLRAVEIEKHLTEYEVTVLTGTRKKAGTDSNVFITLYGKKGVSPKLKLYAEVHEDDRKHSFQAGKEEVFTLETEDIGPISRIKIERDQSGRDHGWFLEKVVVRDAADKTSRFLCYDWLIGNGDGALHKDLWVASKKNIKNAQRKVKKTEGEEVKYEITTVTGDLKYAGTDANIFVKLIGKNVTSRDVTLCGEGVSLERGRTDTFKVKAEDVGVLKKVLVRHDNTGLGAGWFLEKLTIKKYFSKEEIKARMRMTEDENDERARGKDRKDNNEDDDEVEEACGTSSSRHDLDSYSSLKKKQLRRKGYDSNDEQFHSDDSEDEQIQTWNKRTSQRQKTDAAYSRRQREDRSHKRGSKRDTLRSKTFQERFRKREDDSESESEDDDDDDMRITQKKMNKLLKAHNDSDDDEDDDEDVKIMKRKMKNILNKDSDESDDNSDDADDDDIMNYRKKSPIRKSKSDISDSDEDEKSQIGSSKRRVPLYDEYVVPCGRWLAKDEDDGSISRTLKVSTITTIYQVGSRLTDH